jgi:hypothetical protein
MSGAMAQKCFLPVTYGGNETKITDKAAARSRQQE